MIPGLAGLTLVSFAAGSDHAFVLDDTGVVWTWGYNEYGQLGRISTTSAPGGGRFGFVPAPILLLKPFGALSRIGADPSDDPGVGEFSGPDPGAALGPREGLRRVA